MGPRRAASEDHRTDRRMMSAMTPPWLAVGACFLWVAGCGAAPPRPGPGADASAPPVRHEGQVLYEARSPTLHGASSGLEARPARRVVVEVADGAGAVVGWGSTDDQGRFVVDAAPGGEVLRIRARILGEGLDIAVARDAAGRQEHTASVPLEPPGTVMRITASEADPGGFAGALHILDTLLRGVSAVRDWTGRRLPPLFAYWGRGVTTDWSYYRGERPASSGRYCIELLGGSPGQQATSDTDEHDEVIILHELGHFVMDRLTTDSSPGGDHPAGYLLDPGLAWEEGRASWFATSVLGDPRYRDTIGLEPTGSLRVNHDLERGSGGPRGMGSEQGVAEILWDLSDGGPPPSVPDQDSDGVALGPAAVLRAMIELANVPGAYPAIPTLLRHLVNSGAVSLFDAKRMLLAGGNPETVLPAGDELPWPLDIAAPSVVSGKIDGLSDPAPSGGPPRPQNGQDAVRVYRVRVEQRARLSVQLRIFGSGRAADHEDLDLEMRDIRAELLDQARTEVPVHGLSRVVEPGHYLIYVRDGGSGNRVGYELRVWTSPG